MKMNDFNDNFQRLLAPSRSYFITLFVPYVEILTSENPLVINRTVLGVYQNHVSSAE